LHEPATTQPINKIVGDRPAKLADTAFNIADHLALNRVGKTAFNCLNFGQFRHRGSSSFGSAAAADRRIHFSAILL
jgi:hypothetical protein